MATELIKLLSLSTCWTREVCETMLNSRRTEIIEMPCFKCGCCGQIEHFRPYYQVNVDNVDVYIVEQEGIITTKTKLDAMDYSVTTIKGYTEILVDLSKYATNCSCKSCVTRYLRFEYDAGYETLPDCILSDACELLKTITASKLGCGGLDDCCSMSQPELGYVLKSKKMGDLSWTWTQDTTSIEYLYSQLVASNKLKNLGMLSLCGTDDDEESIWAVSAKAQDGGMFCWY